LAYAYVDHLPGLVVSAGRGSFLVKADIKEAYRIAPVHPEDQYLLGVYWEGSLYVDKILPFGLRSAPKIFSALADALQWILHRNGISKGLHYLDDYIMAAKDYQPAQKETLVRTFQTLGVPLEPSKLEGPEICLTFLGIEVDTAPLQLRLPGDKLEKLKQQLKWAISVRRSIPKEELESLVGLLQFATKVVRPGRPFLGRLYTLKGIIADTDNRSNMYIYQNSTCIG